MANSELLGVKFKLHPMVVEQIKLAVKKYGERVKRFKGYKRANYILQKAEKDPQDDSPLLTYEATKRIYHDISTLNKNDRDDLISYDLIGGDFMMAWCQFELRKAREDIKNQQKTRKHAGLKVRDKDIDDEDMTKPTIDPMNTTDERYLKPTKLDESIIKIKKLINKLS